MNVRIVSRLLCASTLMVLVGTAAGYGAPSATPHVDPKIESLAKEWFRRAQSGDFDRSRLTARANAMLTPALAKQVASILRPLGAPLRFSYTGTDVLSTATYQDFVISFRAKKLNWFMAIDASGKLAGLFFTDYVEHESERELLTKLQAEVRRAVVADRFSGAVLVAKNGKTLFAQAYGLADRDQNISNTLETRFRMGSMNKMFTAVATLQLVQAGKIGLDDPLGKYLTQYPNKDVAAATIRQLLTHTGGTGDFFGPEFEAKRLQLRTVDDYVQLYGTRGPLFKPGSRYEYSNYGFILLGAVIEKVSGENYYDFVRSHVYDVAGMTATGSEPEDQTVSGRSVGYMKVGSTLKANTDTLPYRGIPAGGGYTTVTDLVRFADALQRHKLLDAAHTQMLTTGTVRMRTIPGNPRSYAFGFVDQKINGIRCIGHDGGAPGMNGDLEICAGGRYVIAVLANMDPNAAEAISTFVAERLPDR